MKRTAVLAGLDEIQREQLKQVRRCAALVQADDAPSVTYIKMLESAHKCLLQAYNAGAFEQDDAELLPEGLSPHEALRRIEELKQHYAQQVLAGPSDCDGSA